MSPAPKKVDVSTVPSIKDLEVKSIELKPPEDEQEKALRLHKERISFYIKDVVIWIFGVVCLVVIGGYCLWVLTSSSSAPAEKDWARSAVTSILAGIIGYVFGKTTK
jgi:hypothetical protein